MKPNAPASDSEDYEGFEHVIRYEDGIKSDFVLASCSVPINYDYTKLNVEKNTLSEVEQSDGGDAVDTDTDQRTNSSEKMRFFWDGGLLANTPLRQTVLAHISYWRRVRKLDDVPKLSLKLIIET
ncbi:MAG: hypothetical protein WBE34_06785 [Candidatus Nitrosopolaris sp.]